MEQPTRLQKGRGKCSSKRLCELAPHFPDMGATKICHNNRKGPSRSIMENRCIKSRLVGVEDHLFFFLVGTRKLGVPCTALQCLLSAPTSFLLSFRFPLPKELGGRTIAIIVVHMDSVRT